MRTSTHRLLRKSRLLLSLLLCGACGAESHRGAGAGGDAGMTAGGGGGSAGAPGGSDPGGSSAGGSGAASGGAAARDMDLVRCGDECVDLDSSGVHCGSCDAACGKGETCTDGACECAEPHRRCGGVCTDLEVDSLNCGACGERCGTGTP